MEHKTFFAQDTAGNVLGGASVTVYETGTTNTVSLFDKGGNALPNPFNAGGDGEIAFAAANGVYDIVVQEDGGVASQQIDKVVFFDIADRDAAQLTLGTPVWRRDVAEVLADTGNYAEGTIIRTRREGFAYEVAASGVTDHHVTTAGGVKLYVRSGGGSWNLAAFGPDRTGTDYTDGAWSAAAAAMGGSGRLVVPAGTYRTSEAAVFNGSHEIVFEAGAKIKRDNVDKSTTAVPNGLYFQGSDVRVIAAVIEGDRDEMTAASYSNGAGRAGIFVGTERAEIINCRVFNWMGSGYISDGVEGYVHTYIDCQAADCGWHSPSVEYGDGFTARGGGANSIGTLKYLFCRYRDGNTSVPSDESQDVTGWQTRGGFVANLPGGDVEYSSCHVVGAHRSFHMERCPRATLFRDCYGEGARNAIIWWDAQEAHGHTAKIDGFSAVRCGNTNSGVFHSGNSSTLDVELKNVRGSGYAQTDGRNFYRQHAGAGPRSLHIENTIYKYSSAESYATVFYNAAQTDPIPVTIVNSDFSAHRFRWRGVGRLLVSDTLLGYCNESNPDSSGGNRDFTFEKVTFGSGVADVSLWSDALYAGVQATDCDFIVNHSTTDIYAFSDIRKTSAKIINPRLEIVNQTPTTLIHTRADGDVFIDLKSPRSSSADAEIWRRYIQVNTGPVRYGTRQIGNVYVFSADGEESWENGFLYLGGAYIWVDSSSRLRIKGSPPTSDTDGVVVGTQS